MIQTTMEVVDSGTGVSSLSSLEEVGKSTQTILVDSGTGEEMTLMILLNMMTLFACQKWSLFKNMKGSVSALIWMKLERIKKFALDSTSIEETFPLISSPS